MPAVFNNKKNVASASVLSALSHSYGAFVDTAATCTTAGGHKSVCTRCALHVHPSSTTTPALGHQTDWTQVSSHRTESGVFDDNPAYNATVNSSSSGSNGYFTGTDMNKNKNRATKWINNVKSHFSVSGTTVGFANASQNWINDNGNYYYPWLKSSGDYYSSDGKIKVSISCSIHRQSNANKDKLDRYNHWGVWRKYKRHCNRCGIDW